MVKNNGGGNHKHMARKFSGEGQRINNKLRISEDECEVFAQVEKLLGNGMCYVNCMDNKKRLCIIRGKFRGRGKRNNTLVIGTWCLIGLRDYLSEAPDGTLGKCDLLEVYSETDKPRLRSQLTNVDWSKFLNNDAINANTEVDTNLEFTDDRQDDYKRLIEEQIKGGGAAAKIDLSRVTENNSIGEDEVDIDDI
jgi:initiation factor 1A